MQQVVRGDMPVEGDIRQVEQAGGNQQVHVEDNSQDLGEVGSFLQGNIQAHLEGEVLWPL